ncbi:MAG: hypothetical protein Q9208_000662 [Pyrenodesmia sp. 3 TL-2023]
MRQNPLIEDILIQYSDFLLGAALLILAYEFILELGRRFGFYQDHGEATAYTMRAKSKIQIFLDGFYIVFLGLHVPWTLGYRTIILWERYWAAPNSVIRDYTIHFPGILLQVGIFGLAYEISVALARKWGFYQGGGDMGLEAPGQSNVDEARMLPGPEYPIGGQWTGKPDWIA